MKRLISVLIFAVLLLAATSCENVTTPPVSTSGVDVSETTDAVTDEFPADADVIDAIKNGELLLSVESPKEDAPSYVKKGFESLRAMLSDMIGEGLNSSESGNVIVVGKGDELFLEFSAKKLRLHDFFLGVIGDKLYIYAESAEGMSNGVRHLENLLRSKLLKNPQNVRLSSSENVECMYKDSILGGVSVKDCPQHLRRQHRDHADGNALAPYI